MDFDELQALLWVHEHGSLQAASRATGVPRTTLRRRLERLEATLGRSAHVAGPGGITLTAAGSALVEEGGALLAARQRLLDRARGAQSPHDTLRILVQTGLPPRALVMAISMALPMVPALRLHLDFDVDPSSRQGERFDAIVHWGAAPVVRTGFTRTLLRSSFGVMGSAEYLSEHGTPQTPADLAGHTLLHQAGTDPRWPRLDGATVEISPCHLYADLYLLGLMVSQGLGLAFMPVGGPLVGDDIASLIPVLTDHIGEERCLRMDMPVPSEPSSAAAALIRVAKSFGRDLREIQLGALGQRP